MWTVYIGDCVRIIVMNQPIGIECVIRVDLGVGMVTSKNILGINVLLFCYEEKKWINIFRKLTSTEKTCSMLKLFFSKKICHGSQFETHRKNEITKEWCKQQLIQCTGSWSNYSDLTRPISPKWWFGKGLVSRTCQGWTCSCWCLEGVVRHGMSFVTASRLWQLRASLCYGRSPLFGNLFQWHLGRNQYSSSGVPIEAPIFILSSKLPPFWMRLFLGFPGLVVSSSTVHATSSFRAAPVV